MTAAPHCQKHPEQKLICPKCRASEGGKTTASKHAALLSEWGKRGGRPRKDKHGVASQTTESGQ